MPTIKADEVDMFNAPIPGEMLTAELGGRPWQRPSRGGFAKDCKVDPCLRKVLKSEERRGFLLSVTQYFFMNL